MAGDLKIRKVKTSSGATAVQIVRYVKRKCVIVRHIGSAATAQEVDLLMRQADSLREQLCFQPSLFSKTKSDTLLLHESHLRLEGVTHLFAHKMLRRCSQLCGLGAFHSLYQDLALMRIIEPASKLRTLGLLRRYFNIVYAERTVYRLLPQLLNQKAAIEAAAHKTAWKHFDEVFALVLYDVTTLYFESHEPDDALRVRGFSKDDKSKQPQIVVGLLVTHQGFPLTHEVFKGNTFEGHTMLTVIKDFKKKHPQTKPIIVADAAMLSQENMEGLTAEGYHYIVGARLANAPLSFIDQISKQLDKADGATIRLSYPNKDYDVICSFCEKRAKKDRHEFEKQMARAYDLIARQEAGKRAKFIKKSKNTNCFSLNEDLKAKTEKLLGVKGYITNIPPSQLSNTHIIDFYHDLWHVEQAFRVSKTDLRARPIFHHTHEAIKAHVLLCFMALMMSKFLEIKTGLSVRSIKDILWNVHEAHIVDALTKKSIVIQSNLNDFNSSPLAHLLLSH